MKEAPEVLFGDFGESGFDRFSNRRQKPGPVFDIQFHTNRPKAWIEHCMRELETQFRTGKLQQAPEKKVEGSGHRIVVLEELDQVGDTTDTNPGNCRLSVYIYDNGTVLIQGSQFVDWCEQEFHVIKAMLDAQMVCKSPIKLGLHDTVWVKLPTSPVHCNKLVEKMACSSPVKPGLQDPRCVQLPTSPVHCHEVSGCSGLGVGEYSLDIVNPDQHANPESSKVLQVPFRASNVQATVGTKLVVRIPPVQDVVTSPLVTAASSMFVRLPPVKDVVTGLQGNAGPKSSVSLPPSNDTATPTVPMNTTTQVAKKAQPIAKFKSFIMNLYTSFPNLSQSRAHSIPNASKGSGEPCLDLEGASSMIEQGYEQALIDGLCSSMESGESSPVTASTPEKKAEGMSNGIVTLVNTETPPNYASNQDNDSLTYVKKVAVAKDAMEEKNKALQKQNVTMKATIDSLQKGKNVQKARLDQLISKIAALEIDLVKKEIELDASKKVQQETGRENQFLKNAVKKIRKDIEKTEPVIKELKSESNQLKLSARHLEGETAKLRSECKTLKSESDQLKERARHLEGVTAKLRSELGLERAKFPSLSHNTGEFNIVLTNNHSTGYEGGPNRKITPGSGAGQQTDSTEQPAVPVKDKVAVRLVGDSLVRGMGPLLQANNICSIVVTKPGAEVSQITDTIQDRWEEDILAIQCGTNDIRRKGLGDIINSYDAMLDKAMSKTPDRPIIVTEVPQPGGLFKHELRKNIKALNTYLANKCDKNPSTHFLPLEIKLSQMQGVHLNPKGQKQMAEKILSMVNTIDQTQNFLKLQHQTLT
jgi:hypothetical protein